MGRYGRNRYYIEGDQIIARTTRGEVFLLSEEDRSLLFFNTFTRNARGYFVTRIDRQLVYLHRLVCPCDDDLVVDHWNGKTWDNRRENLRPATRKENMKNRSDNRRKR